MGNYIQWATLYYLRTREEEAKKLAEMLSGEKEEKARAEERETSLCSTVSDLSSAADDRRRHENGWRVIFHRGGCFRAPPTAAEKEGKRQNSKEVIPPPPKLVRDAASDRGREGEWKGRKAGAKMRMRCVCPTPPRYIDRSVSLWRDHRHPLPLVQVFSQDQGRYVERIVVVLPAVL